MSGKYKSYPFQEPVNKLTFPGLGKVATFEISIAKTLCYFLPTVTMTASATGAATKTIPRPSWGVGETRFKLGNVNRTRLASELFGVRGLNALMSVLNAGTVRYYQAGALITVAYNGFTIGNEPVLIDSAEDAALQAALANNTATVAEFGLPFCFAEDWRNDPTWAGEGMALPTAFDNGTPGVIGGILGTPYYELDIPAATGVAGTMTAVNLSAEYVYTESLAKKGTTIQMSKEKVHLANYSVGDVDIGDKFDTKDILQRFSILTAADKITKVVVKQGSRIIRQVKFAGNHCANLVCQVNGRATIANRFDVELDIQDDPTTAVVLDRTRPLSIVATFATAADNPATARILASYYGPVEA